MSFSVRLTVKVSSNPHVEAFTVFERNYTSNVFPMMREAGIVWGEYHEMSAAQVAPDLHGCIDTMESYPDTYRALNPENGWGDYEDCLDFLKDVEVACWMYDKATVHVS